MPRLFLLVASVGLLAQAPPPSADGRYHQGAQAYVNGDNASALEAVDAGLAFEPDNERLQALRDLIQQDQQEQDQQDGGQQDEAQNSDPGDEGEEGDEGESGENPPDEGSEPPPGDGGEADADQTNTEPQDPASGQEGQSAPTEAGEMTEAQAQRLLDAVGGEEQLLLRELRRAPTRQRQSDKDW
ncbi:hypothetical protein [Rubrivirga sp.]|uniref:hypothetical protein n=1 Tax=Rubrivirga sp. TaxID=1885344 RepID=UPI003C755A39